MTEQQMEQLFQKFMEAMREPECQELARQSGNLLNEIKQKLERELSGNERKALDYIRREVKEGRSPSVRQVALAVGARSSKTGARLVQRLRNKMLIK